MTEEQKKLKHSLLQNCLQLQQKRLSISGEAMLQAQESANNEKGTMGDKYESFREQMQIDRDMYARQYEEGKQVLNTLNKVDPEHENIVAALGAVIITDSQKFFVSASLGQIKLNDENYMAISVQSPMFQSMAGKKAGENFSFRDKKFQIKSVF